MVCCLVGEEAGVSLAVPREVYLNLSYYQMSPGRKRLVEASVNFGELCTVSRSTELLATMAKKGISPCALSKATDKIASIEYTLQVSWVALDWFELMNLFQFTVDVYLAFFMLVGLLSILVGFVVWLINRLFTRMKKPPRFRFRLLLKNTSGAPTVGIALASIPLAVGCAAIHVWWVECASSDPLSSPNAISFEATAGDWLDQTALDKARVVKYKMGRVGLSLIVAGGYMIVRAAGLLVPDTLDPKFEDNAYREMGVADPDPLAVEADNEEEEESEVWNPIMWKRAHLLLVTMCFIALLLVVWEVSYSALFTANIYAFLVLYKVVRSSVEPLLEAVLHDKLLALPLMLVLAETEDIIAMGSADFLGFTLFYFANLSFLLLERLYLAPLVRHVASLWPKWRLAMRRKLRKKRRRTREQKAQDEAEWRRVCERIDAQAAGVEVVMDALAGHTVTVGELFLTPLMLAFQVIFSSATQMPALYSVEQTDLLYYALFALFIIPSNLALATLQLHTLELAHGWKLYEYVAYQRHRFASRDHRWPLAANARTPDESLHPAFQSLDLLCFSSQLYFVLALFAIGVLLVLFGLSTFLRHGYSFFGEPIALLILVLIVFLCYAIDVTCVRLGDRLRLWRPSKLEGTLDDELAAKLALGAGRQADLERERLELQALNSERFRHRFLDRNRPWVLQHLVELFTPRTLGAPMAGAGLGPDGAPRPASEFVRDIYHELMQMGEGRRLAGDRSDISSDGEDELERMRRQWSNVPVEGASHDLALWWLARARKRRAFAKLVAGIVAGAKASECARCGKAEAEAKPATDSAKAKAPVTLMADLAGDTEDDPPLPPPSEQQHDANALDRLIDGFERGFGERETDADLWKAFFRKRAVVVTLCDTCSLQARRGGGLAGKAKQAAQARRALRGDDLSSDEEDEPGQVFAPVIVARGAVEGRVLSKWLLAARRRLGGAFPRPEAAEHMERYARKMRASQARRGKAEHVDSDEEDPSRRWRLSLDEAGRALALRWLWQARDVKDAAFRAQATRTRAQLDELSAKMLEVDDWFFGRELRLAGVDLVAEGRALADEQQARDDDMRRQVEQTTRDADAFESDKRATTEAETRAFEALLARDADEHKAQVEAREIELLEAYRTREADLAVQQRAARDEGTLTPALANEHRSLLAKLEADRTAELANMRSDFETRDAHKREAFERKLALVDAAIQSRRALAQHRVLAIRKEAMTAVRARETNWQSRAAGWMDKAGRKVAVREQEDLEAQEKDKKRRKRALLAS